jgi:FkbM family methyltransferase
VKFLFRQALRSLTPDDIAIDCGANVGVISRLFAERGATVYAFEPDPYAFERLEKNVGHFPNVRMFNQAVGASDGKVELYRHEAFDTDPELRSQSSSIFADKRLIAPGSAIEVEMIDLCTFIEKLDRRVAILKMDIEGAEVPVIESLMKRQAIDKIDLLVAEAHGDRIPSLTERTRLLRHRSKVDYPKKIYLDWR